MTSLGWAKFTILPPALLFSPLLTAGKWLERDEFNYTALVGVTRPRVELSFHARR